MKKWLYGFLYSLIAILFTTQVLLWADGVGVNVKPTSTALSNIGLTNSYYASLHIHTSVGQFYNLSTTGYQQIKGFSTSTNSSDITVDKVNGTITLGTNPDLSGKYLISWHTAFKATEGALMTWDLRKNGSSIHMTSREMTAGPERSLTFFNNSGVNTASDIAEYTAKTLTNITSDSVLIQAFSQKDGRLYHIDENATQGTPAFVLRFGFGSVDSPKKIFMDEGAYAGHEHTVKLKVLNTVVNRYTSISNVSKHFPDNGVASLPAKNNNMYFRSWNIPMPTRDYVDLNGITTARIVHGDAGSNGGYLEIDKLGLQDALNSLVIEISEIISLSPNDVITLWIKSDTINTEYYSPGQGIQIIKISQ